MFPKRLLVLSKKLLVLGSALLAVNSLKLAAQQDDFAVGAWVSTEFHPKDSQWYTNPWPESQIPRKLEPQSPILLTQMGGTAGTLINVDPATKYQTLVGIGSSLEHTSVYAIRKNKTAAQQREVLSSLIDPVNGMGLNLFRVTIGTSDFADGTRATPAPLYAKGWYSYMDTPSSAFSIERDRSLGIIDTVKMAVEVGNTTGNPLKIVASPWSPPAWMRQNNNMVSGGPLLATMLDSYAAYLRKFVEAYSAEGIPIYAISLQNERLFEPGAYPGMVMSWQMERDLAIKVYENFHNIGGNYGAVLNTKLWTLDHNFDYWNEANQQLTSLKSLGKAHYVDATAFHHYSGNSDQMGQLHAAHPDKNVIFTEGSIWGVSGDKSMEGLVRHFRNWATGYMSWVTMTTQTLNEANQGPYNGLGIFDPTLIVKNDGANANWYKTPEFYLLSQFSRYIKPGAQRIDSTTGNTSSVTNVAFLNPDNTIVLVVVNSTASPQPVDIVSENHQISASVPAKSLATYRWKAGLGNSPYPWTPAPTPVSSPYSGSPVSLPGIIEAENYDLGGQGVSYSDSTTGNSGSAYRSDDVDVSTTTDNGVAGYNLGWVAAGEWLQYSVNVQQAGNYKLSYRVATPQTTGQIQFIAGGQVLSTTSIPATGDWTTWATVESTNINLAAGSQIIRIKFSGQEVNLNNFTLALVNGGSSSSVVSSSSSKTSSSATSSKTSSSSSITSTSRSSSSSSATSSNVTSTSKSSSSSSTVSGVISGRNYVIVSKNSGKALDVSNNSISNGATIQQWAVTGAANQLWTVTQLSGNTYKIISNSSGKSLDVAGVSTSNGATIQQWDYSNGANQHWIVTNLGNGYFKVIAENSNKSLDVKDVSTADGAGIQQWDYSGANNQQWQFQLK
jgi:glucosylceramidase